MKSAFGGLNVTMRSIVVLGAGLLVAAPSALLAQGHGDFSLSSQESQQLGRIQEKARNIHPQAFSQKPDNAQVVALASAEDEMVLEVTVLLKNYIHDPPDALSVYTHRDYQWFFHETYCGSVMARDNNAVSVELQGPKGSGFSAKAFILPSLRFEGPYRHGRCGDLAPSYRGQVSSKRRRKR